MGEVSLRELRNHGGDVVDRVAAGENVTVTRGGQPVAELRPVARRPVRAEALLSQWRRLPIIDRQKLCHDLDALMDAGL